MVVKTIVACKTWIYVSKTYGVGSNPAAPANYYIMFWIVYLLSIVIVYVKFDFLFSLFLKDNPQISVLEEEKRLVKLASILLPIFNTVLAIGGILIKEK